MSEVFTMKARIDEQRTKVELNSRYIDEICMDIINKHTKDLDALVDTVRDILSKDDYLITGDELESIALKIPVFVYSLCTIQEQLGIRADISKSFEKDRYAQIARSVQGTVKEKEYAAMNETQAETVVSIVMARVYKMIQMKIQIALELLASIKKVMNKRAEEMDLNA